MPQMERVLMYSWGTASLCPSHPSLPFGLLPEFPEEPKNMGHLKSISAQRELRPPGNTGASKTWLPR